MPDKFHGVSLGDAKGKGAGDKGTAETVVGNAHKAPRILDPQFGKEPADQIGHSIVLNRLNKPLSAGGPIQQEIGKLVAAPNGQPAALGFGQNQRVAVMVKVVDQNVGAGHQPCPGIVGHHADKAHLGVGLLQLLLNNGPILVGDDRPLLLGNLRQHRLVVPVVTHLNGLVIVFEILVPDSA